MIEVHPFGYFAPKNTKYLILGSFTGKDYAINSDYDWFYSGKRNQLWQIFRLVYGVHLNTKDEKVKLFKKLGISISDIIYSCERKNGTNLDNNLINITYNYQIIENLFKEFNIKEVFFTSKFVEKKFKQNFKIILNSYPKVKYNVLPSPSPRYAKLNIKEKVKIYEELLPKTDRSIF